MLVREKLRLVVAISDLLESRRKFNSFFTTEKLEKYGLIPAGFRLPVVNEEGALEPESEEETEDSEEEGIVLYPECTSFSLLELI